jgi:hypothetical protein
MAEVAAAAWELARRLPWKWIGIALAAVAALTLIWRAPWAESRQRAADYAHFQPKLDRALHNIIVLKGNQARLLAAIDRQNAAVSALKAEGDKRTADGKAALVAAARANAGLSSQADELRKSAGRKVDSTPCPISDTLKLMGSI